ncbi:MAG: hypothetical protein PHH60_05050, partial [Candidatus Margulisbacteria bacterium]|nr:hypothetical protein [Candidatus Margulisiibacteriota bacterium]
MKYLEGNAEVYIGRDGEALMKLDDKIRRRKIAYMLNREPSIAFELALLYFIQAKRRMAQDKILEACNKSIYWLRKTAIRIPDNLKQLCFIEQLKEIEILLVHNKAMVGARLPAATGFGLA